MDKTHDEGIFEGLKELGEATIFLPWFRIRAIATPLKVDAVA
jgi:hypothetical protein